MDRDAQREKIARFYELNQRMPSYSEIAKLVGYKSKNAVYKLIDRLIEQGFVSKDSKGRLLPAFNAEGIPLLGLVEAGIPAPAEVATLDMLNISDYLVSRWESTFLLEVKGNSMIEAHIEEGDLIVAERSEHARDGDIVVAEVDGDWTLKYYREHNGKVWLQPANKDFKDIHPEHSLRIGAVVKGVIRKL